MSVWLRSSTLLALAGLLLAGGAWAQDAPAAPPAHPAALAARFLGYDGAPLVPELRDTPALGETGAFYAPQAGSETPVAITAELVSLAPGVAVWADVALDAGNVAGLTALAPTLQQIFSVIGLRENYYPPLVLAGQGAVSQPDDVMPVPDVDNDRRLNVVFVGDTGEATDSFVRTLDSLPAAFVPGPWANARETIFVSTASFPTTPLTDPLYLNLVLSAYQDLLANTSNPAQAPWLRDALALALRTGLQGGTLPPEPIAAYLEGADVPLFSRATLANRTALTGGQQLFLGYLGQRFGPALVRDLWPRPGDGTAPLEAALADADRTDFVTGAPMDLNALFADFALANLINARVGDGRYVHTVAPVEAGQSAQPVALEPGAPLAGQTVNQYGADYYAHTASDNETVTVQFSGGETAGLLRLPSDQPPDDSFYWSGRAPNANPTLTRAVDLTGVTEASLSFDAAWDFNDGWDYGYVSVSADGGVTWTILPPTDASPLNRHGFAYGPGFTGISNPEGPRPFPALGVVIGSDGITAIEVPTGGAAAEAGIRPGDQIVGYHGEPWPGAPNVLGLLAEYRPGDTLPLLIRRNNQPVEIPVVLGAHPTRVVEPEPRWLPQTVDLTPYAGQSILLRFEAVTQPGRERAGLALDRLAIDAIDWFDDGAGEGWTFDGWAQTTNTLPQPWIVQAVTSGSRTDLAGVHPLIGPGDAPSGEWSFTLAPGETLLLAVSAANASAARPATYDVALSND